MHRRRVAFDPSNAPTQRELAMALVQLGQAAAKGGDREGAMAALREGYEMLRPLKERGALEAQFHEIVDQLARAFGAG